MHNIKVTIPDEAYRRARIWVAERNTSVSAVVQYLLDTLPGVHQYHKDLPVNNLNQKPNPK